MSQWGQLSIGLIYQIYGLAFFVLGVVVYLLPKRNSTFHFVHHLSLLAKFGVLHGLLEFIELEMRYNSAEWLIWLSRGLLVTSFLSLLEFGRRIFNDLPNCRREIVKSGV